jgi:hypothetical protein
MIVGLFFALIGIMDASLFDAKERASIRQWPFILLFVLGHAFLLGMLVSVIRGVRRKQESWLGDRAIKGLYIPWIYFFLGVAAKVWYFH